MKSIKYIIIDSKKIEKMNGTILYFGNFNKYNIKRCISSFSGIPIESINQLYYITINIRPLKINYIKYNNSSFNTNSRIYAEVSDLYFYLSSRNEETNRALEECERKLIGNKRRIEELGWKNEQLQREIQNEREIRQKEAQKISNFKIAFEESKKRIENNNLEKSKEYINKLIANKFVKEFDNEKGKKKILLQFH